MSTVTTVTPKTTSMPAKLSGVLGQLRTLKDGKLTVTLTAAPDQLEKLLPLLTACQSGDSLSLSVKVVKVPPKKKEDAPEKRDTPHKKEPRRVRRYPYK